MRANNYMRAKAKMIQEQNNFQESKYHMRASINRKQTSHDSKNHMTANIIREQ